MRNFKKHLAAIVTLCIVIAGLSTFTSAADYDVDLSLGSADDLAKFSCYYADDAREGLKAANTDEWWRILSNDTAGSYLARTKPAGFNWWHTNADQKDRPYHGSETFGCFSELVYKEKTFVNFELELDMQTSDNAIEGTTRDVLVGFGIKKPGDFYVADAETYTFDPDGGVYAFLRRNMPAGFAGYCAETLAADGTTTKTKEGKGKGEDWVTYSDTLKNCGSAEWHHVKLVVNGGKASFYVDNSLVKEITLKNYKGGYIALAQSGPSGMKNLKIKSLGGGNTNPGTGSAVVVMSVMTAVSSAVILSVKKKKSI